MHSYALLRERIAQTGRPVEVIGRTHFGLELVVARTGGDRIPPIVLTAGSHADEVAGVCAAVNLVQTLTAEHTTYIIPCRDPLGWEGFMSVLSRALGRVVEVSDSREVRDLLHTYTAIVYEESDATVGVLGDLAFASISVGPYMSFELSRNLLPQLTRRDSTLRSQLAGKRVLLPANIPYLEGRGFFDWGGNSAYITPNGEATHLNRLFDQDLAPVEVSSVKDFLNRIKPGLTLDLHEGFGSKFYLFVPGADSRNLRVAEAMIRAVREIGIEPSTYDELKPFWGAHAREITPVGNGIFTHVPSSTSLSGYAARYGPSVTTEPGMDAPVSVRVHAIEAAAIAAIRVFETM